MNASRNPTVLDSLPAVPTAPKVPNPDRFNSYTKFKSKASQYKVDLDYYIASLENQVREGNKGVDLTAQLEKAEKQRQQLKNPDYDYKTDFNYTVAPIVQPMVAPIPDPAPVVKISSVDVKGPHGMTPGLYIDGERVASESWPAELEERLENALHDFEHDMDQVEHDFDAAMDKFDSYLDDIDENPEKADAKIGKANSKLAKAAVKANQDRDALTAKLDRQIAEILADAEKLSAQTQKLTETKLAEALAQVNKDLSEAEFENKWEREEFRRDMRELQKELREQEREIIRETRDNRQEIMREAEQARREAMVDRKEAEQIAREASERARKDMMEAREQAAEARTRGVKEAEYYANYAQKEAAHVKQDYRDFRHDMMAQLKKDGLVSRAADSATVTYKDGDMFVNGVKAAENLEDNYCAIKEEFHIYKKDNATIRLLPNGVELENSYFKFGDTRSTRWTYSEK